MKTLLLISLIALLTACSGGSSGDSANAVVGSDTNSVTTLYKLTCRSGEVQVERYPGVYSGWIYELEMYSDGSYRVKCDGATDPGYTSLSDTYVDSENPKFPDKSCTYTSTYRNAGGSVFVRRWDITPPLNITSGNRGSIEARCTEQEASVNAYCDYDEPTALIVRTNTEPSVDDVYGTCSLVD
jgi:hypothetical protein